MALKFESTAEFNGPAQFDSKIFVNGTLWDTGGNQGTTGQVLTKDASNNVMWQTPSGGGGSIDGSGTANKGTYWVDGDTLGDMTIFNYDSANDRIGINNASPSYDFSINAETDMGGGTFHYDHINKRIGINTASPSQKLDVAGAARFRNHFYDGSNTAGTSGQILKTTGSATQWASMGDLDFRQSYRFVESNKIGTSGTKYLNWAGEGAQTALSYTTSIFAPHDGEIKNIYVTYEATASPCVVAVYKGTTNIYSSGNISLTADTTYNLTPSGATFSQDDQLNVRFTYPTAGSNVMFMIVMDVAYEL